MSVSEIRDIFRGENGLRSSRNQKNEAEKQNSLRMLRRIKGGAAGHLSTSSSDRYEGRQEPGSSRHGSENRSLEPARSKEHSQCTGGRLRKKNEKGRQEELQRVREKDVRNVSQCTAQTAAPSLPANVVEVALCNGADISRVQVDICKAAELAAAEAQHKARTAKPDKDGVLWAKCFFLGLTYGVKLLPSERACRQSLAKAINDKLLKESLACEDGSNISVLMMTTSGEDHEFLPGKDEGWSAVAPTASRIYVAPLETSSGA